MNNAFVLKRPIITEKSQAAAALNTLMFEVDPTASKHDIKRAVESLYKVHVIGIRTVTFPSLIKRTGKRRLPTATSKQKRAYIQLKPGETLPLFETNTQA